MISSEPVAASSRITRSAAGSSRSEIRTTTPRPESIAPAWRAASSEVGRALGGLDRRTGCPAAGTRGPSRAGPEWRRAMRPDRARVTTRSSPDRAMYPRAAAARFANSSFWGLP